MTIGITSETTSLQLRRWVDAPSVVAVLVVRDGETFLPRTLAAIAAQTRPPDRLVAVDTGSQDGSIALLEAAASGAPWHLLRTTGSPRVPDAVDAVLADPAHRAADAGWVWVLPDDAAPAPEALERLLAAVETAPSVAVAGCKQVSWDDGQRLLEVGSTTSRFGARITGVDRGEVDQGQHDRRSDILAVGTAGMLVRRDAWEQLRISPAKVATAQAGLTGLTGARDDLDLCRRLRLAGHRVVVVPGAVVARRPRIRYRDDRRDALFLRLVTAAWPLLGSALIWSVFAGFGRGLARILVKQPAAAADEVLALVGVLARPDRWLAARRQDRSTRRVPLRTLRPLRATGRQLLRQRRDEVAAWIVPSHRNGLVGAHAHPQPVRPGARPGRGLLAVAPVLLLAAAAAVTGGWALLTGSGAVAGPFLRPAPEQAWALWSAATASWRGVGPGAPGLGDPLGELLALASVPLGADPGRLMAVLLVGAPVLAAGTGWVAAGQLGAGWAARSWAARSWAALAWAAAPSLLAGTLTGRPGAVLAHILLPLLAIALWRSGFGGSVTAAAAAGLLLTAVLAAAPVLAVPAVVAVLLSGLLAVARGGRVVPTRQRIARLAPAAVSAAVPAVLLLPWWSAVARRPLLLLADPALGWTGQPGPALWAGLPVAVVLVAGPALPLALVAPLRRGLPGAAAIGCWLVALSGLGVSLAGQRSAVGSSRSWGGPGESVAFLGLLTAALLAVPVVVVRLRRLVPGVRQAGLAVLAAGCAFGPVLALAGFGLAGLPGDRLTGDRLTGLVAAVQSTARQSIVGAALVAGSARTVRVDPDVVPAVAAAASATAGSRTLALAVGAGPRGPTVRWALERGSGARLGDASVDAALVAAGNPGASDDAQVLPVISALLSGAALDVRPRLADLAVGFVLLLPPVDEGAAQALDAAPGLVRVGTTGGRLLWRVDDPAGRAARLRVLAPDGSAEQLDALASRGLEVDATVGPGPAGRQLVLSERADPGWHAALDGVPLARAVHAGWAQAFVLPAAGGRLQVTPPTGPGPSGSTVDGLRLAAALVTVVVAVPLPRVRRRVAPPPSPRRSRPVIRDPRAVRGPQRPPGPRVFDDDHPADGVVDPVLTPVRARRRLWWRPGRAGGTQ